MSPDPNERPEDQLERDQRFEARLLWKGLLALVIVLAIGYARHRWWLS